MPLQTAIVSARPDQIPVMLSSKFQQTLVNSLAQQDRLLHMAAKKVVTRMTAFAQNAASPALRVSLAVALQRQGAGNFDRQTHTKTVAQLLQVLFLHSCSRHKSALTSLAVASEIVS